MKLELLEHGVSADTRKFELQCVNAEPNYGTLWLKCKRHPLDSTRQVLRVAKSLLISEKIWINGLENSSLFIQSIFNMFKSPLTNDERRWSIYSSDPIKP